MTHAEHIQPPDLADEEVRDLVARLVDEHEAELAAGGRSGSQGKRGGRVILLGGLAALAVAAAVALALGVQSSQPAVPTTGSRIETAATSTDVTLSDGTTVELRKRSSIQVLRQSPRAVTVRVTRGSATFDVAPNAKRRFSVVTPEATVTVLGTRFTVSLDDDGTRVAVSRGRVQVVRAGSGTPVQLAPGESWGAQRAPAVPSATVAASASARAATAVPSASTEAPVPSPGLATRDTEGAAKGPTADRLLERANAARGRGDYAAARSSYEELVRRYPKHPAASLAALELGRLRMRKGDAREAADALKKSLSVDPGSPVREHSLANLVEAHERAGDLAGCRAARARYLAEFPKGVRAVEVRRRCARP